MIELNIGGVDVSDNIINYSLDKKYESTGRDFTSVKGETIRSERLQRAVIAVTLEELSDAMAARIEAALAKEEISVTYSSPSANEGTFICTGYNIDVDDPGYDGNETVWNMTVNLEESSSQLDGDSL